MDWRTLFPGLPYSPMTIKGEFLGVDTCTMCLLNDLGLLGFMDLLSLSSGSGR